MILQPDEYRSRQLKYAPLEKVGASALQQCGVSNPELTFISDTGNVIFRAETANQTYTVRIYPERFKTTAEIYGELFWLLALKKQTNLIVPQPLSMPSGKFVQEIAVPTVAELYHVVLFHWLPGEMIGTNLTVDSARQIGKLMAELHNHAAGFELPDDSFRDATDWHGMGCFTANLTPAALSRIRGFLNQEQLELCEEAAERVAVTINTVSDQHNFGLIHSDLHTNNCLSHQGRIGIIDFDDCQFAPFSCDMAITMSSFDQFQNRAIFHKAFLQGYSEKRELPPNYVEEIDAFTVERKLRLIRWVATWPTVEHFSFGWRIINNSLKHCKQYVEAESGR